MVAASKVLMLKPEIPITTAEEKAQRRLEVKARSTLMMGIPNEHQLKFNSIKDAKKLLEAVEKRFGGNAAPKKTKRNILKQQYENFTAPSSEMLDQTFDRLQKLNTHVVVWRNKADLDTMNMDDIYNNLQKTRKKLTVNHNETIGFDKSNVECYNLHKRRHFARDCRAPRNKDKKHKESSRKSVLVETSASTALVSCDGEIAIRELRKKLEIAQKEKDGIQLNAMKIIMQFHLSTLEISCLQTPDLSFTGLDEFVNKHVVENYNEEEDVSQPKVKKKTVRPSIDKIEFVKPKEQEKTARKTIKQAEQHRQNTHNGKEIVITESSVRRDLQLEDEKGIDYLSNSNIFEQLALMGKPKRKDTQVPQPSGPTDNIADEVVHKELGDRFVRATTIASSLKAEQDIRNITKTQSKATPNESSFQGTNLNGGPRCQETIGDTTAQTRFESVSKHSNDSLLVRGNTLQSDEDSLKLNELMELCTNLQNSVLDLEKTKTFQRNKIDTLKRRVKKIEQRNRSRTHKLKRLYKVGLTARVKSSRDE
nr:ribonuclease H-like domain-containing protein [Tanacetum cinerariifolium]